MKKDFVISIETLHLGDQGNSENVHQLSPEKWRTVEVVNVDIVNDPIRPDDYKKEEDPTLFRSQKTGRGPLRGKNWWMSVEPVMTCYKLVTCEFKWFGLQTKIEKFIQDFDRRLFTTFHRQIFCWIDQWYGLSMDDIRQLEDRTQKELEQQRAEGPVRGTMG
ncbi:phosphatidylinositol transfer protein beta isoform-like [Penaeus japonicus]|uniref:phosphatidylinositol transfer protein beta isoform-like n=1 Tax=Penaeus japonicus TaxID=27405 RepID=UPI001C70D1C1|nr:phosphatidylinositol transfer protein beta isoform-like [Penaeus japonicus]XP_042858761.1 phosphatidylinositol transfer protein beta isoform-like [Penaeus japonicus]